MGLDAVANKACAPLPQHVGRTTTSRRSSPTRLRRPRTSSSPKARHSRPSVRRWVGELMANKMTLAEMQRAVWDLVNGAPIVQPIQEGGPPVVRQVLQPRQIASVIKTTYYDIARLLREDQELVNLFQKKTPSSFSPGTSPNSPTRSRRASWTRSARLRATPRSAAHTRVRRTPIGSSTSRRAELPTPSNGRRTTGSRRRVLRSPAVRSFSRTASRSPSRARRPTR